MNKNAFCVNQLNLDNNNWNKLVLIWLQNKSVKVYTNVLQLK